MGDFGSERESDFKLNFQYEKSSCIAWAIYCW
jgi:hypothetical protein